MTDISAETAADRERAAQAQQHISDQAVASARELVAQGWDPNEERYDIATYYGDAQALEERLGRKSYSYEREELERQIRGYLADPTTLPT
jgi:hypothetical protein